MKYIFDLDETEETNDCIDQHPKRRKKYKKLKHLIKDKLSFFRKGNILKHFSFQKFDVTTTYERKIITSTDIINQEFKIKESCPNIPYFDDVGRIYDGYCFWTKDLYKISPKEIKSKFKKNKYYNNNQGRSLKYFLSSMLPVENVKEVHLYEREQKINIKKGKFLKFSIRDFDKDFEFNVRGYSLEKIRTVGAGGVHIPYPSKKSRWKDNPRKRKLRNDGRNKKDYVREMMTEEDSEIQYLINLFDVNSFEFVE